MVGLERSTLPIIGREDFGIASSAAVLSFIVAFGLAKALTNLAAGASAARLGRRRLLITGWALALPVPLLIAVAPSWAWIVAANVLLGVNQGLAWSMTVVMKIDLVGPQRRGLALGLNEAAGYGGVAVAAALSGWLAGGVGARDGLVGGAGKIWPGHWSDGVGRKPLIVAGMLVQSAALALLAASDGAVALAACSAIGLGVGTALVYPTLIAAISDAVAPVARASVVGVYRFWRDMGYAAGGLAAGLLAAAMDFSATIVVVPVPTPLSGISIA